MKVYFLTNSEARFTNFDIEIKSLEKAKELLLLYNGRYDGVAVYKDNSYVETLSIDEV